METKLSLRWDDLISPTMSPEDYLEQYKDKIAYNYSTYNPNQTILEKVKQFIKDKQEMLKIVALGADWCPDCNRNVPRMIRIIKTMNEACIDFRILYGIMVNALHKPGEAIWHKTRSPPEALDPKFDLKKIPSFYFFNKRNELIGIIQENPKKTLEEDMLVIIRENF